MALHPSQEKVLDVLIVRPEMTKSCMYMFVSLYTLNNTFKEVCIILSFEIGSLT